MALLDSDGPLDLVFALFAFQYTLCWHIAFGWQVPAAQTILKQLITFFGLLPHAGLDLSTADDAWNMCGATMTLPLAMLFLPRFLGTENAVGRHHRQMVTFWLWFGYLIYHSRLYVLPGNNAFGGTTCNAFWILVNAVGTGLHYKWVGGDIQTKLKLA